MHSPRQFTVLSRIVLLKYVSHRFSLSVSDGCYKCCLYPCPCHPCAPFLPLIVLPLAGIMWVVIVFWCGLTNVIWPLCAHKKINVKSSVVFQFLALKLNYFIWSLLCNSRTVFCFALLKDIISLQPTTFNISHSRNGDMRFMLLFRKKLFRNKWTVK